MAICLYNGTLLSGFSVMEQCAVLIEDGKIADVFSQKRFEKKHFEPDTRLFDVQGAYIAPGFIDTHITVLKDMERKMSAVILYWQCPKILLTMVCLRLIPRCILLMKKPLSKQLKP